MIFLMHLKKSYKVQNMQEKRINISKTTACHVLSSYFTSKFEVPHGQSVANSNVSKGVLNIIIKTCQIQVIKQLH